MANYIDGTGLHLETRTEVRDRIAQKLRDIYGSDINLESNSPDGQMLEIFVQEIEDVKDLTATVFTSFDPDQAAGRVLDQRVVINNIQRQGGTYTTVTIRVTLSDVVSLFGQDQSANEIFTVSDNEGNTFQLLTSALSLTSGTHDLTFVSSVPGAVQSLPNTLTTIVTTTAGVESVTNPSAYLSLGEDEESDTDLRERRRRSTAIGMDGYVDGLQAYLENLTGVTYAKVYENDQDIEIDGIPAHSIWVIVGGSAQPQDIAEAIYRYKAPGCGLKGEQTYYVLRVNGTNYPVKWDVVESQIAELYLSLGQIVPTPAGVEYPDVNELKAGLIANLNAEAEKGYVTNSDVSCALNSLSDWIIKANYVTDGRIISLKLPSVALGGTFKLEYNEVVTPAIDFDVTASELLDILKDLSDDFENAEVTGDLTSGDFAFIIKRVPDDSGLEFQATHLLLVNDSSLGTTGSFPVNFLNIIGGTPFGMWPGAPTQFFPTDYIAKPSSLKRRIIFTEDSVVLYNDGQIYLSPRSARVPNSGQVTIKVLGGVGPFIYFGGGVDPATGIYTAPSSGSGVAEIYVRDRLGATSQTIEITYGD